MGIGVTILGELRDDLATILTGVAADLNVYDRPVANPSFPCVQWLPGEPYLVPHGDFAYKSFTARLIGRLMVEDPAQNTESTMNRLDDLLVSLCSALWTGVVLASGQGTVVVETVENFQSGTVADTNVLTVDLLVRFDAQRS
jgi:hypothetical protein